MQCYISSILCRTEVGLGKALHVHIVAEIPKSRLYIQQHFEKTTTKKLFIKLRAKLRLTVLGLIWLFNSRISTL